MGITFHIFHIQHYKLVDLNTSTKYMLCGGERERRELALTLRICIGSASSSTLAW